VVEEGGHPGWRVQRGSFSFLRSSSISTISILLLLSPELIRLLTFACDSTRSLDERYGPKSPNGLDTLKPSLNRSKSSTPPSSFPSMNSPFELAQPLLPLLLRPLTLLPEEECDPTTQQLVPQQLSELPLPLPTSPSPRLPLLPNHLQEVMPSRRDREPRTQQLGASRLLDRLDEDRWIWIPRIPAESRGR